MFYTTVVRQGDHSRYSAAAMPLPFLLSAILPFAPLAGRLLRISPVCHPCLQACAAAVPIIGGQRAVG